MNKKEQYIKDQLLENIDRAKKCIKNWYTDIKEIEKLPNDCYGIDIDGHLCENNNYKIEFLTGAYHQIGYMECLKEQSKQTLKLNDMNNIEFDKYLINQENIRIHNESQMKRLKNNFK